MSNVIFLSDGYEATCWNVSIKRKPCMKIQVLVEDEDIGDIDLYFTKQDLLEMLKLFEEHEQENK